MFGALIGVAHVARGTFVPISAPEALTVSLDPANLPDYAVRTTLRMFAALAGLAAVHLHLRHRRGEKPARRR